MGFIEDLRRQKIAEEQDQIRVNRIEEERLRERNADFKRSLKESEIRQEKWRKAENYFKQTGIEGLANEIIDLKSAKSLKKPDYFGAGPDYLANLVINDFYSTTEEVSIQVSSNGDVAFTGEEIKMQYKKGGFLGRKTVEERLVVPLVIKISLSEWQENKSVLEDALGKVYKSPLTLSKPELPSYPIESCGQ